MNGRTNSVIALIAAALLPSCVACAPHVPDTNPTEAVSAGGYEVVTRFFDAMPTGVAMSRNGRVFVNYPRWGDHVPYTVAEIVHDGAVPFPDAQVNSPEATDIADRLQSVQSVVVDAVDRLWLLDTGSIEFGATRYGGPKLVAVDLSTNQIVRRILFPPDVALPTTYLNDVRFDLSRGAAGMAFITDSSPSGPNAIVVVDLATGKSWRRLQADSSVRPVPGFQPVIDGGPLVNNPKGGPVSPFAVGSDGIAISADGKRLYYCPLSSRQLYDVSVEALADPAADESAVAATVRNLGEKGMSDGLESDDHGNLYGGDLEHNGLWRRTPDGRVQQLARSSELAWIDTLSVGPDGYLYFTANQLHRQPAFHMGTDLRRKPYLLLRTRINAGPVLLR